MTRIALVLCLALTACAQGPCPDGQARDNEGVCVLTAASVEPNPFDQFDAPSKAEYIADQDAIAEFNQEQEAREEADYQARRADRAADQRTNRIVEAQQETQRSVEKLDRKLGGY